jgi:hypothetical protein
MRQSAKGEPVKPASSTPAPVARGKSKERSGSVVASCICVSEYQDARYGRSMRVFNLGPGGGKCAVCGAKRQL